MWRLLLLSRWVSGGIVADSEITISTTMRMAGTDAARCGLHRTYYSGIERGVRNVSLVNIEKAISRSKAANR
jgi:hypothetical protein